MFMHELDDEIEVYIDTETGELVHDLAGGHSEDFDTDEEALDALAGEGLDIDESDLRLHEQIVADRSKRYRHIEKVEHWIGYQDMKDFIEHLNDAKLQDRLAAAIDGKGAFGRFKDVLDRSPGGLDTWYAYKNEREESRAREWLDHEGITIVD
jgi:hypothetical protein